MHRRGQDSVLVVLEQVPDLGNLRLPERDVLRAPRRERRACSRMDLWAYARERGSSGEERDQLTFGMSSMGVYGSVISDMARLNLTCRSTREERMLSE